MTFLDRLMELMPDNQTLGEDSATVAGLFLYHTAPETMAAICRELWKDEAIHSSTFGMEAWAARVKEALLEDAS